VLAWGVLIYCPGAEVPDGVRELKKVFILRLVIKFSTEICVVLAVGTKRRADSQGRKDNVSDCLGFGVSIAGRARPILA